MAFDKFIKLNLRYLMVDYATNEIVSSVGSLKKHVIIDREEFNSLIKSDHVIKKHITAIVNDRTDFSDYAKVINITNCVGSESLGNWTVDADVILYNSIGTEKTVQRYNYAAQEG